jgi:hypothetical protein
MLKGHGANATTQYNEKFFETAAYPLGSHTLTVTYNGDTSKTPLVLAYLAIRNDTASSTTGSADSDSSQTPAIVGGVIGGVAFLLIVILLVVYRRRKRSNKDTIMVDEPNDYVPASEVIHYDPRSRSPAKMLDGYNGSSVTLSPGHHPGPSGSSINTPATATYLFGGSTTGDGHGQHSRNPSDSHVSDTTGRVGDTSNFVVHRDSGARLPQMPQRLVDIPPAYTPD